MQWLSKISINIDNPNSEIVTLSPDILQQFAPTLTKRKMITAAIIKMAKTAITSIIPALPESPPLTVNRKIVQLITAIIYYSRFNSSVTFDRIE